MKIVIAPDSFKGCLRSPKVCEILKHGILSVTPDANVICIPMADGGEGTVDSAIQASNGSRQQLTVTGPLGEPVDAEYGLISDGRTAVMEMASASGIELIARDQLNPMKTTTFGTGEIISKLVESGVEEIIIGIGGSATVDGGAGMAQALGYRLLDDAGEEIPRGGQGLSTLRKIIADKVSPSLRKTRIRVACDVTNPLLGPNGAATIFGPQKGATPDMVEQLEAGLGNLAQVMQRSGLVADVKQPGDGAAGGLGAGLRAFCGATIESGAELLIELNRLESHLAGADFLITGEGKTDAQTSSGKLCAVIADTAHRANVPVILVSGALEGDSATFADLFDASFSITTGPCTLDQALATSESNLALMGRNLAQIWQVASGRGQ